MYCKIECKKRHILLFKHIFVFLFSLTLHLSVLSHESPSLGLGNKGIDCFLLSLEKLYQKEYYIEIFHISCNIQYLLSKGNTVKLSTQRNIYISSHTRLFNAHKVFQHFYITADCLLSIYFLARPHIYLLLRALSYT